MGYSCAELRVTCTLDAHGDEREEAQEAAWLAFVASVRKASESLTEAGIEFVRVDVLEGPE